MLIYQSLAELSARQPEKLCLIHGRRRLTYREFSRQVGCLAERLAIAVKRGDKVLIRLSDAVDQLLYFFGIIKAGGICIFVDSTAPAPLCDGLREQYGVQHYVYDGFQPGTDSVMVLPEISPRDIFLGALSSGSTGTPKLIWRDHQSWTSAFAVQSQVFAIDGSDTLYLAGSLSYTANLNACLHMLAEGGTVVVAGNNLPRTWAREIVEYQVSTVFMVPAHYRTLLRAMTGPLDFVRSLVSAGAKMDGNTVRSLIDGFPGAMVCEYYGASELGHVSYAVAEDLLSYPQSVGKAFPGVNITVEEDVIWVESPYLAPACRPRATVGDLGNVDDNGYLTLLGRQQSLINTGGVKVIPEQVEAVLRQCPGIAEAAVTGVRDGLRGEKVCAWIVKQDDNLSAGDIRSFCRSRMNTPSCPQRIMFLKQLPVNAHGKVDKMKLTVKQPGSQV